MKNFFLLFLFYCLLCSPVSSSSRVKVDSILNVLDYEIENRHTYHQRKEDRIDGLREQFHHFKNPRIKFDFCDKLYNEYMVYKFDSAYVYANKTIELATLLEDHEAYIMGKCNLLNCYISAGLFKEGFDTMKEIDVSDVSTDIKSCYYTLCVRLLSDMKGYTNIPFFSKYDSDLLLYCDSALKYLPAHTYEFDNFTTIKDSKSYNPSIQLKLFHNILDNYTLTLHEKAKVSSRIGHLYNAIGDMNNAIYYMALSAICDTRSAVCETTAKKELARFLSHTGDIIRASSYVRIALEEANFYNARHRKMEINAVLPIVEKQRLEMIQKQKTLLTISLLTVSILLVALAVTMFILRRQMKKLKEAKLSIQQQYNEISIINDKLQKSYSELETTNHKLRESNEIRDQYIIQTLWGKSEHLEKIENLLKQQARKIRMKQYDDLQILHKDFNIKVERENMFSAFDETFQRIFPNFLDEYNSFFAPEDQVTLDEEGNLPPEFRIFALIRLGIVESERIAKFLNLSVNTIYSYKGKVKSKAIIPKEEFEYRIMHIKKK